MGKPITKKDLETPTGRASARKAGRLVPRGRPYCVVIVPGVRLGYRCAAGGGTWVAVTGDGKARSRQKVIATADDSVAADGSNVLDYEGATRAALAIGRGGGRAGEAPCDDGPLTVEGAVARYKAALERLGGDTGNATRVTHNLPRWLAKKLVRQLTVPDIQNFQDQLRKTLAPSGVNRLMNAFRSALNDAARDLPRQITSTQAWRGVPNLPNAQVANNVIFNDSQIDTLVHACRDQHGERFGLYVWVHAETGARTVQVEKLNVGSLRDQTAVPSLLMPSANKGDRKGNKRKIRYVPVEISVALAQALRLACGARGPREPLLLNNLGRRANRFCDYRRRGDPRCRNRVKDIAEALGLPRGPETDEAATMYALRHSSIVRQLLANISPSIVAKKHDTSIKMLEDHYAAEIAQAEAAAAQTRAVLPALTLGADRAKVIPLKRK
jgi:hypothetical protein